MPAVAAVPIVLLALFALLLYYGAEEFGQALVRLVPNWFIPGLGSIRSGVAAIVNAGVGLVQAVLKPVVAPAISFLTTIGIWTLRTFESLVDLAPTVAGALHRLFVNVLPGRVLAIQRWALGTIRDAVGLVTATVDVLRRNVWDGIQAARDFARTLIAAGLALLTDALNTLRVNVWAGINQAKSLAHDLVHVAETTAAAGLAEVRHFTAQGLAAADHELSLAVSGLESSISTGVHAAETYASGAAVAAAGKVESVIVAAATSVAGDIDALVTEDVHALLGVIATDFPDIRALLGEVDIPAVGSIAGVLGLSVAMDRVLARYLKDCGIPNCRNLGGLGRFIAGLAEGVATAGLLGLLVDIVEHPETAAREVAADIAAPMNLARDLARDLVGVG